MSALRAEWTKFATVRGWVLGVVAVILVIAGLSVAPGMSGSCGTRGPGSECGLLLGPGGVPVSDGFTYLHQPGAGSLTVRVGELRGPRVVPWAKAGLILKAGTAPGSGYVAVMRTGQEGVRLQWDYTHDVAAPVLTSGPVWLRLDQNHDLVTAAESPDGTTWTTIGQVRPAAALTTGGVFVTSPQYVEEVHEAFLSGVDSGPSPVTAGFDHLATSAATPFTCDLVGGQDTIDPIDPGCATAVTQAAGSFTLTGSGDIAPALPGGAGLGVTITQALAGTFLGLLVLVVVAAGFVTSEYRRGLARITLTATPNRLAVLTAKTAVVLGVTFAAGLAAAALAVAVGPPRLRHDGVFVWPAAAAIEVRVVVGTAALLAFSAVLALALGTLLRRGLGAVLAAVVLLVVPYVLAMSVLPGAAGRWVLRVSPAAAFAVQQASPVYHQVTNLDTASNGYFPLSPPAGLAVLAGWTLLAWAAAALALIRRDA